MEIFIFVVKITQLLLSLGKSVKCVEYMCGGWLLLLGNLWQDNSELPDQMPQRCLALKEVGSSGGVNEGSLNIWQRRKKED